ncbi:MAG: Exonuclease RNase and polymerase [Chloroflexi bacterium]|nr:Exonuclease RNase and polymerase [Chloroflexota bacterium]
MALPTYVALDLEFIEANTPSSRVIEIGAVRFNEAGVLDEWTTLVNPGARVPYSIRLLTGIDDRALDSAPPLDEVAAVLGRFVGDEPIVGQSVEIDVAHLARQGIRLPNPQIDTYELATALLPGLPAYDITSIARALGMTPSSHHRAVVDAHLAREILVALLGRIRALDLDILMQVNRVSRDARWPFHDLFLGIEHDRRRRLLEDALAQGTVAQPPLGLAHVLAPPDAVASLSPASTMRDINVSALAESLAQGGSVAATVAAYEERPEQIAMLRAVAEAFNGGAHLVVEAGTGVGKSLAYLLPSLAFAAANDRRVVVSTNTINLQDQLYDKDIPDLIRATGHRLRTTVLKGRSNYLCLRRWIALLRSEFFSAEEASLLVKTLLWIRQTKTGDRGELRLTPEEELVWSRISSQAEGCSPLTCPYHREGSCFIARARRAAEASHIVIVNHALLLSDVQTKSRVVPEYDHLIVDEAHHLESEATTQLGFTVSARSFFQPVEALRGPHPANTGGAADLGLTLLRGGGLPQSQTAYLLEQVQSLHRAAPQALATVTELFDAIHDFVHARAAAGGSTPLVRLTGNARNDGAWQSIEQTWEGARGMLENLRRSCTPLIEELSDATASDEGPPIENVLSVGPWASPDSESAPRPPSRGGQMAGFSDVLSEILAATNQLDESISRAQAIIAEANPAVVCWASDPSGSPSIHSAPLDVAEHVRRSFLEAKSTVVMTSATLTTDGTFDYVRQRLGTADARELALGSPFDYQNAALLLLPSDIPEPSQPGYTKRAADAIADTAVALGGRTLALFTSYAQLRATRDMIHERIDREQIVLMSQGTDGSRSRLVQRFRATERALLLGTASFWEGVDIVGDALSALVITRLPFAVPTDPVFAARSEQFDEPFSEYAVPQAILRFKQGFGRLIRSQTDRGVVVVLDRRIQSKSYGAAFLNSLPPCTIRRVPSASIGTVAQTWLSGEGS